MRQEFFATTGFLALALAGVAGGATITVTQVGSSFSPKNVQINVGDSVKWVWTSTNHTTSELHNYWNLVLDAAHPTQTVTFDKAFLLGHQHGGNLYNYLCQVHPFEQTGTVKINTWLDLGYAKAGTNGLPALGGMGALQTGQSGSMNLVNARPNSLALLFMAVGTSTPVALAGGTLAAFPIAGALSVTTNGSGIVPLPFTYPGGALAGLDLTFQYAIQDPVATNGVALSNAVQTFTQ